MKKECNFCGYYNPKARNFYKCFTGDCPAIKEKDKINMKEIITTICIIEIEEELEFYFKHTIKLNLGNFVYLTYNGEIYGEAVIIKILPYNSYTGVRIK